MSHDVYVWMFHNMANTCKLLKCYQSYTKKRSKIILETMYSAKNLTLKFQRESKDKRIQELSSRF